MKAIHLSPLVFLALLQFSCQPEGGTEHHDPFDLEAIGEIIESKTQQFTEAHVTGDQALLDSIFTDDAHVYAPNSDVITGLSEISKINAQYLDYGITEFREQSTSRYGGGDYLVDEGTYILRYGMDNTVEEGHYLNVWKRIGNDWKIHANMWTTLNPPTPQSE